MEVTHWTFWYVNCSYICLASGIMNIRSKCTPMLSWSTLKSLGYNKETTTTQYIVRICASNLIERHLSSLQTKRNKALKVFKGSTATTPIDHLQYTMKP